MKIKRTIFLLTLILTSVVQFSANGSETKVIRKSKIEYLPTENVDYRKFNKLGCGTNFIDADYIGCEGYKPAGYIFQTSWLNQQMENVRFTEESRSFMETGCGYEYTTASANLNLKIGEKFGISAGYDGVDASGAIELKNDFKTDYSKGLSSYYCSYVYSAVEYNASLPNASNYDLYRYHLSNQFISDTKKWVNGSLPAKTLFNKYGTHIITSGYYGTAYTVSYCASSSSYDFKINNSSEFDKKVEAAFSYNGVPLSINSNSSQSIDLGVDKAKFSYNDTFSINSIGGDTKYGFSTISELNGNIKNWLDTKEGKEVLLYPSSYIPLWQLLPKEISTPSNVNKLSDEYTLYIRTKKIETKGYFETGDRYVSNSNILNKDNYVQGSFNKKSVNFDTDLLISLNFEDNYEAISNSKDGSGYKETIKDLVNIDLAKNAGYKYFSIQINFWVKEKDDGDRTVGIFKSNGSKKATDALLSAKISGGSGIEGDVLYSVNFDGKKIDINDICNNMLYTRFGSCGNGFNGYHLNNVSMKLTFSKN